jgi:hypothetical protein
MNVAVLFKNAVPSRVIRELVNKHLDEIPEIVDKIEKEQEERMKSILEVDKLIKETAEGKI